MGKLSETLNGNKQAQGVMLDQLASSPLIMSYISLSIAILYLVEDDVGCGDLDDNESCEETVWGVKPSSITTFSTGISGLLGVVFMPICGAITDYTPNRRKWGMISAFVIIVINAIQIFVGKDTWEMLVVAAMIGPPLYFLHTILLYAYIVGLSDDKDELTNYISKFDAARYIMNLVFLLILYICSTIFDTDAVDTAIIGQVLAVIMATPLMYLAWKMLPDVDALQQKPEDASYLTAGFKNIFTTSKNIGLKCKEMKWLLRSMMFASPCFAAVTFIGPTFSKEFLEFDTDRNLLVLLVVLITGVPGALMMKYLVKKKNALFAYRLTIILGFLISFFCAGAVTGPDAEGAAYVYFGLVGFTVGGYFVSETSLIALITPPDQETEIMGLYVFFTRILIWICPIIMTVVNERDIDLNTGMIAVQSPCVVALLLSTCCGSYENLMKKAGDYKKFRETISKRNVSVTELQDSPKTEDA